jgi:hypothetical protein
MYVDTSSWLDRIPSPSSSVYAPPCVRPGLIVKAVTCVGARTAPMSIASSSPTASIYTCTCSRAGSHSYHGSWVSSTAAVRRSRRSASAEDQLSDGGEVANASDDVDERGRTAASGVGDEDCRGSSVAGSTRQRLFRRPSLSTVSLASEPIVPSMHAPPVASAPQGGHLGRQRAKHTEGHAGTRVRPSTRPVSAPACWGCPTHSATSLGATRTASATTRPRRNHARSATCSVVQGSCIWRGRRRSGGTMVRQRRGGSNPVPAAVRERRVRARTAPCSVVWWTSPYGWNRRRQNARRCSGNCRSWRASRENLKVASETELRVAPESP